MARPPTPRCRSNEGGTVVIMDPLDATEALRLIEAERVTTAPDGPGPLHPHPRGPDWRAFDRSSIRKILHAAAPCPVPVKRKIIEVFRPVAVWE